MTTATDSRNNGGAILPLLILAVLVAAGAWCVTNQHAIERHGPAAADVAAAFNDNGQCKLGPSAVMKAVTGVEMFICFEEQDPTKIDLHVQNSEGGTITDIPSDQISKPVKYLRSVLPRDGYTMETIYGVLPDWFLNLIGGLQ